MRSAAAVWTGKSRCPPKAASPRTQVARPPGGRAWTRWPCPHPSLHRSCFPPYKQPEPDNACQKFSRPHAKQTSFLPGTAGHRRAQSSGAYPGRDPYSDPGDARARPHGRLRARRPLTAPALSRPRCPRPWGAAAAGGVRGVVSEAQPEEDTAPRGEEGAPGRRLPGRGGPHGRLQGL